jgi:uncharacterized membrane protein
MLMKRTGHIRVAMSLLGGLIGLAFIPIMNLDYFLPYAVDKLGMVYAVFSFILSSCLAWLFTSPQNIRQGALSVAVAIIVSGVTAFVTLQLHPNSTFNNSGDFDWGYKRDHNKQMESICA